MGDLTILMAEDKAFDLIAPMRTWMTQWEKFVNEQGGELLRTPETARAVQAFTGVAMRLQAVSNEATGKMLAAANLPSRADIEALGTRMGALEAALARIEARLNTGGAAAPGTPVRRTRKPPAA